MEDQSAYFNSHSIKTYDNCRYQPRMGKMKVKGYVDALQDCNYGYYTNEYNGTQKTFYFWIVAKNYLARENTELTFQIDVFQTWLFDFKLSPCMIEREHVDDDTFGRHTLPEDFELGDYITYTKKIVNSLTGDPCYFVGLTDNGGITGGVYGKTYSGFTIKYFSYEDACSASPEINAFIKDLCDNGKADSIAFIFTFPKNLLVASGNSDLLDSSSNVSIGGVVGTISATETFNWNEQKDQFFFNTKGWKPYNCKLYCYPFNFITIKNSHGGNVVLKLENFSDTADIEFKIEAVLTQHPTISLTPMNYCGKSFAIDDSITMDDYGLCSWNNDNYANWFAQHRNSINAQSANATASMTTNNAVASNNWGNAMENRTTNAEKGVINTALSTANAIGSLNFLGATTNAIGGLANTYLDYNQSGRNADNDLANANLLNDTNYQNTMRSIVASVKDAQVQPNTCKGSTTSCGLDMARDTATFFIEQTGIKPEYAKIIDMYFQMFGYQVNEVKEPNLKSRTRWNYIKTVNCTSYGNLPHEDMDAINSMFNNGLTIWHDESYMYNYSIDNAIK
jgi:hypothetical protein